jgi:hypothetical protein
LREQSCRGRASRSAADYQHVTSIAALPHWAAHPVRSTLNDLEDNTQVMS